MTSPLFLLGTNDAEQTALVQEDGQYLTVSPIANTVGPLAALGNWFTLITEGGATVPTPHDQTTNPTLTFVGTIVLVPQQSGIFLVSFGAQATDSLDTDTMSFALITNQGTTAGGILAGGAAAGKAGTNATGAHGMILNVDAAGGNGITFEGAAQGGGKLQYSANIATAAAVNEAASWSGIIDAVAATSATKTPFTIGKAAAIGVQLTAGAGTVSFSRFTLSAYEMPFG